MFCVKRVNWKYFSLKPSLLIFLLTGLTGCYSEELIDTEAENHRDEFVETEAKANPVGNSQIDSDVFLQLTTSTNGQVCNQNVSNAFVAEGPSVVFNNPTILEDAFSLRNVLTKIADPNTSDLISQQATPDEMMTKLLEDFSVPEATNHDVRMPLDVRDGEADIAKDNSTLQSFLDNMKPTALFNRFDLAPLDGGHCGEYRITYGMQANSTVRGRMTLIFEATYPNPKPFLGRSGCLPVVKFWNDLQDSDLDQENILKKLQAFYFNGVTVDNFGEEVNLIPVLGFEHFKAPLGQIRINHFINFQKWQLREFRTAVDNNKANFEIDTVKGNPLAELYGDSGTVPENMTWDTDTLELLREDFQSDFLQNQMQNLLAPELNQLSDPKQISLTFSLKTAEKFNEFQSDAGNTDNPQIKSRFSSFKDAIEDAIPVSVLDSNPDLTADHILNRAGVASCGGCHQFSAGREIAPNIIFPRSLGFVHVSESGALSEALKDLFLPARKKVLDQFICEGLTEKRYLQNTLPTIL